MTENNPLISVEGLHKSYQRGNETIEVLKDVNLTINQGDFIAFMGPSGSGKTSLLNILGGIDTASSGRVVVGDNDISKMSDKILTNWRADNIGIIFQQFNLIPVLTAFQNVELPLLLTGLSKEERAKRVEVALSIVNLEDRMDHFPSELSGGQEQRVAIARSIIADPTLLLCDEPTGDLDETSRNDILDLLVRLVKEYNKTILMVTHDPLAAEKAHTVLHLEKGKFVENKSME